MGDPKFEASQKIPNVTYSRFAELIGLRGIYIDDPEMFQSAWQQAQIVQMLESILPSKE